MNAQIPAVISAVIFGAVALFQLLLAAGLPFAHLSWGGKHQGVLPGHMRLASLLAACVLVFLTLVLLVRSGLLAMDVNHTVTLVLVWVITAFMGLNTLGNLASKSRMEKVVMAPLTGVACVMCLLVAVWSS
ncbi:hypothetical protein [Tumebacillus flagellatus]|uniref:Uncharacterized protein n=1 Tax=Tumebacillus flagellatus TaxID=1157490 RepID=A0A074LL58_9BACL|nr:hypothetical protein [Tumebacillus flagellatus]KEO81839.1 hypothetical protein EL26_18540 [Tumebacillus flagellatus]